MALSLLFIVDPLAKLKAYKDSSVAMMREAAARGHAIFACTVDEMAFGGVVRAKRASPAHHAGRPTPGTRTSARRSPRSPRSTRC